MCCGCTSYRPCEAYCMTRLWRVRNRAGISYPPLAACAMALGWDGDNTANTEIKITVTLRERQKLVNKGMQNVFPRVRERLLVSKQDAEFFTKFLFFFFFQPAYNPHKRCPHPLLTHDFWDKKRPWSVVLYLQSPPALSSSSSGKPKSRSLFDLLSVSGSLSAGCSKKKKKNVLFPLIQTNTALKLHLRPKCFFSGSAKWLHLFPSPRVGASFHTCVWLLSVSYFFISFMNSKCFFSSSRVATFCSLICSFCCVFASSSRSHAFSWHSRRTCALNFCFSASTYCKWCAKDIITWNEARQSQKPRNQIFFFFFGPVQSAQRDFCLRSRVAHTFWPLLSTAWDLGRKKIKDVFFLFFFFFHLSEESLFSFKLPLASSEPRNATK